MNKKHGLLIVDSHELTRKGLKSLFRDVSWARIIGEVATVEEALPMASEHLPDLVVFDPSVHNNGKIVNVKQIRKLVAQTKVLILTYQDSEAWIYDCLDAGVSGYVVKKSSCKELLLGIQTVLDGEIFLSPSILADVAKGYLEGRKEKNPEILVKSLTRRESEVFDLVGSGQKNREVANLLFISIKTVEKHRASMMRKLGLKSPAEVRLLRAEI